MASQNIVPLTIAKNLYNRFMAQNYSPIDHLLTDGNEPSKLSTSYAKETEPILKKREAIGHAVEQKDISEVVENIISQEVSPHVEVRKEAIDLPPDLSKMGVRSALATKFTKYKKIVLPISDEGVARGLRAPINSSARWLAEYCVLILKKAHMGLRIIHGKVRRVLIRS